MKSPTPRSQQGPSVPARPRPERDLGFGTADVKAWGERRADVRAALSTDKSLVMPRAGGGTGLLGARVLVRCRLGTVLVPMGCPVLSPGEFRGNGSGSLRPADGSASAAGCGVQVDGPKRVPRGAQVGARVRVTRGGALGRVGQGLEHPPDTPQWGGDGGEPRVGKGLAASRGGTAPHKDLTPPDPPRSPPGGVPSTTPGLPPDFHPPSTKKNPNPEAAFS